MELVKKAELCLLSNLSEYFVCMKAFTGEISSVGGHHDQREEPPHDGHSPSGKSSKETNLKNPPRGV